MAIEAWTYPIHEIQEGEVDREWTYLSQYYKFPGNLEDYAAFMDYVFKKEHAPNQFQTSPSYDKILKEAYNNSFEFHRHDIKKGHAPSKEQLKHWSRGDNCKSDEKYTWKQRKTSYRADFFIDITEESKLIYANFKAEGMYLTMDLMRTNKSVVEKEKTEDKLTPNKMEASLKGNKAGAETLAMYSGDAKDVNANLKLEAEGEFGVETNINVGDNKGLAKAQEILMRPEYVEFNHEIMEKVADELKEERNSNG